MSGGFRQQIGLAKGRLSTYINEARGLQANPDQGLSPEAHIAQLTDLTAVIEHHITRMQNAIDSLVEQDKQWISYLTALSQAKAKDEEALYNETTTKTNNFFAVMDIAREAIDVLRSKLKETNSV